MQRQPTPHADDIGARLGEPSSLVEPIRTTGVPKYRIAGSITCEFAVLVISIALSILASLCEASMWRVRAFAPPRFPNTFFNGRGTHPACPSRIFQNQSLAPPC